MASKIANLGGISWNIRKYYSFWRWKSRKITENTWSYVLKDVIVSTIKKWKLANRFLTQVALQLGSEVL